jgi:maleate isomerase
MSRHVEAGAKLLSDAQVDAVVFHCTAVSTFSPSMGEDIEGRIARASGLPAISTSEAILTALRALKAKKIVLLTPYIDSVNAREVAFLEHHGFEVLEEVGLGVNTNAEMAKISPQVWVDLARNHQCEDADAYFISCTAVRSAEVIEEIEALVGRPVITSNQAMVWYALRKNAIADHQPGFGSLFSITSI